MLSLRCVADIGKQDPLFLYRRRPPCGRFALLLAYCVREHSLTAENLPICTVLEISETETVFYNNTCILFMMQGVSAFSKAIFLLRAFSNCLVDTENFGFRNVEHGIGFTGGCEIWTHHNPLQPSVVGVEGMIFFWWKRLWRVLLREGRASTNA